MLSIMLDWLWDKLERERGMIKNALLHFLIVCAVAAIIILIVCFTLFGTALELRKSTIEAYKDRYGATPEPIKELINQRQTNAMYQIFIYTNNPNSEGLIPQVTNLPAISYRKNGVQPVYFWETTAQSWKTN